MIETLAHHCVEELANQSTRRRKSNSEKVNTNDQQLFDSAYSRTEPAFGNRTSFPLAAFLNQTGHQDIAFDLEGGAGQDSVAMAAAGYRFHCFDLSAIGLTRIEQQADESG